MSNLSQQFLHEVEELTLVLDRLSFMISPILVLKILMVKVSFVDFHGGGA